MTGALAAILGVILLNGPDEAIDRETVARVSAQADAGMREARPSLEGEKSATITAERSDFDREAQVVMFDRNVRVEYGTDYVMNSDRLFVFMGGSNELSRIVALGHVAITNDTRAGLCEMAKFWRRTSEIEMFGGEGRPAQLCDEGGNDVRGSCIRFWLDTEQVDVVNPEIQVETKSAGGQKFL